MSLSSVVLKALFPVKAISSISNHIRERAVFQLVSNAFLIGHSCRLQHTGDLYKIRSKPIFFSFMLLAYKVTAGSDVGCFECSSSAFLGVNFHARQTFLLDMSWNEAWARPQLLLSVIREFVFEPVSLFIAWHSASWLEGSSETWNGDNVASVLDNVLYIVTKWS